MTATRVPTAALVAIVALTATSRRLKGPQPTTRTPNWS